MVSWPSPRSLVHWVLQIRSKTRFVLTDWSFLSIRNFLDRVRSLLKRRLLHLSLSSSLLSWVRAHSYYFFDGWHPIRAFILRYFDGSIFECLRASCFYLTDVSFFRWNFLRFSWILFFWLILFFILWIFITLTQIKFIMRFLWFQIRLQVSSWRC